MTITTPNYRAAFAGDGATTVFSPVPPWQSIDDLVIELRDAENNVQSWTHGTQYVLSDGDNPEGGTLTAQTGYVPATGEILTVAAARPSKQKTTFPTSGRMPVASIENSDDDLTLSIKAIEEAASRALRFPLSDLRNSSAVLPLDVDRAGGLLGFDGVGSPTIYPTSLTPTDPPTTTPPPTSGGGGDGVLLDGVAFLHADVGLAGNGTTDDSYAVNLLLEQYSDVRLYKSYRFNNSVLLGSGNTLDLSGTKKINLGKNGRFRVQGEFKEVPGGDEVGEPLFKLQQNANVGNTVIYIVTGTEWDTSLISVGSYVIFRGQSDGAGGALQRHETRVTATDFGSQTPNFTISDAIPSDEGDFLAQYPAGEYEANFGVPDRTTISVKVTAPFQVDGNEGDDFITIADTSQLSTDDWLLVIDDELASDTAGVSNNRVNQEVAKIIRISGGTQVHLSQPLYRDYAVSKLARVEVMEPVQAARLIAPPDVDFRESPDPAPASRIHTFEITYGVDCELLHPRITNERRSTGSRGNGVRMYRSHGCRARSPVVLRPRYVESGDGYGVAIYSSTHCWIDDPITEGCRHGILFSTASGCRLSGGWTLNTRLSGVDAHGLNSVRCWITDHQIINGGQVPPDANQRSGIRVGNSYHLKGDRDIIVTNCYVYGLNVANDRGIDVWPPSGRVLIQNTIVEACGDGIRIFDNEDYGSLVTVGAMLDGCRFINVDKAINVDGQHYGAPAPTLTSFTMQDCRLIQCTGHVDARGTTRVVLRNVVCDDVVPVSSGAERYAIYLRDVLGAFVENCFISGTDRGVYIQDCPDAWFARNTIHDLGDTAFLTEQGGNTSYRWVRNEVWLSGGRVGTVDAIDPPSLGGLVDAIVTADSYRAFLQPQLIKYAEMSPWQTQFDVSLGEQQATFIDLAGATGDTTVRFTGVLPAGMTGDYTVVLQQGSGGFDVLWAITPGWAIEWGPDGVPDMTAILDGKRVKVTMFMDGDGEILHAAYKAI